MEAEPQTPGGRFMTDEEKAELGTIADRNRSGRWVLPALCWLLTALDLYFLLIGAMHGFQILAFFLLLLVTLVVTFKLWQGVQLRSQMLNDLNLGTLVNDQLDGAPVEHLPISSLLWTVNGEPAPWRQALSRSR